MPAVVILHISNLLTILYVVQALITFMLVFNLWPRSKNAEFPELKIKTDRRLTTITILILSLLIVIGGTVYYSYESEVIRKEKFRELNAIAELKINQIKQWQKERHSEAHFFSTSEVVVNNTLKLIQTPETFQDSILRNYIEPITSFRRYENISIYSTDKKLLYSIHPVEKLDLSALYHLNEAQKSNDIYFSDIFYCNTHQKNMYLFIAPIRKEGNIIAWLLFDSNPEGYLFPLIESWPVPGKTAETLILVKEGDSAVFKNRLRFKDNEKLDFKVPLKDRSVSAVAALSGHRGYFEGVDYRGVEVLSYIDTIPDSPWIMIAEIDKDEMLSELRYRAVIILILCLVLILLSTAAVIMINRSRQRNIYQKLYHQEKELRRKQDEIFELNKELENKVLQRTEQLESTNKELESFSYTVSHDLRAPLRHINAYVGLLNRSAGKLDEKSQHYIRNIKESSHLMEVLIENILKFSRTSRQEMHLSMVSMNEIVSEVVHMEMNSTSERDVEWKIADLPPALCDSILIRQVWYNLISNAIKFSTDRKPAVIEIGYHTNGTDEITYYVKDNGVGFDMKYVHRIFEVFHRLHDENSFEGSGIGLATVKRIVSKHGGTIKAEGEPGAGACFSFTLPVKK